MKEDIKSSAEFIAANIISTTREVLTIDEAAKYMGISKSYLYKLTMLRKIPCFKPNGKMFYYNRLELERWLQNNAMTTYEAIPSEALNYFNKTRTQKVILTDYYKFEKLPEQHSKQRIDCTASTKSYSHIEALRATRQLKHTDKREGCNIGDLFLYIGDNTYTKAGTEGKADLALSKTKHISSIFTLEPTSQYWYGDFHGTTDALLFIHNNIEFVDGAIQSGAIIEIFVVRGYRRNKAQLYNLLQNGELDSEIKKLRNQSVTERLIQSNNGDGLIISLG